MTAADPSPAWANPAGVVENDNIVLSWAGPDDAGITGHRILRRSPAKDEETLLVCVTDTGSTPATYTDRNPTAGVRSVCQVGAINSARTGLLAPTSPRPRCRTRLTPDNE